MHAQFIITGQPLEHVVGGVFLTSFAAVDREVAPLAHKGLTEAGASALHLAGIRVTQPGHGALDKTAAGCSYCWIHSQG